MLQIIYASAATQNLDTKTLAGLLQSARRRNAMDRITGYLLHDAGSFLQVIEGPDEAAAGLYARIVADPRHNRIRVLSTKPVSEREFGEWAMAFSLTQEDRPPCGEGFLDHALTQKAFHLGGSEVCRILMLFQQGLLRQADNCRGTAGDVTVTVTPRHGAPPQQRKYLLDFGQAPRFSHCGRPR
jgi:hypothetical protein